MVIWNMLKKFSRMAFLVGLLAVISLSVIPQGAIPDTGLSDKLGHLVAYACLALAGGIAYSGARSSFMLISGLLFLGVGLELVQTFLPGRSASGYDVLANVIGTALGAAAAISISSIMNRRPRILG